MILIGCTPKMRESVGGCPEYLEIDGYARYKVPLVSFKPRTDL